VGLTWLLMGLHWLLTFYSVAAGSSLALPAFSCHPHADDCTGQPQHTENLHSTDISRTGKDPPMTTASTLTSVIANSSKLSPSCVMVAMMVWSHAVGQAAISQVT
jgi:hypothetical protein